MKSFSDYINLKELAAYDLGTNVLGKTSLDPNSERALTAAMEAFEAIMAKNSQQAVAFLNRMATAMPELHAILQKNGLDSFKDSDFKNHMRRAASKGNRIISKGLGDLSLDDANSKGDVITTPSADSYNNPVG